jgi:YfiH family protein
MRCSSPILRTMIDPQRDARQAALPRDWIVPDWPAPPGVVAFTTTRNGPDGIADLDLAGAFLDPRVASAVGRLLPPDPIWQKQVHGITVATITTANLDSVRAEPPHADALVTRLAGIPLAVKHADCLPILLSAADGSVIAAVHAGWRGLAAGIVETTMAAMGAAMGPAKVPVVAWFGPAIGPAAFEVGPDVVDAFRAQDRSAIAAFAATGAGKWHADLYQLARLRLAACGVSAVAGGGLCTVTDSARFFSHRRDRDSRRMATFIHRALH